MRRDHAVLTVRREDSPSGEGGPAFQFPDGIVPTSALTYAPASVVTVGDARFVQLSGHTGTNADIADLDLGAPGATAIAIGRQTDAILDKLRSVLERLGGTIDDIVRVRVYVRAPLAKDVFETVHAARRRYFHGPRMPASTLVEVAALVRGDALIEIDADAVITSRQ